MDSEREAEYDVLVNVVGDVMKAQFAKLQDQAPDDIAEALQQVAQQLGRQTKLLTQLVSLLVGRPPRTFTIRHDDGTESTVTEGPGE